MNDGVYEYIRATIYTTSQGAEVLAGTLSRLGIESYSVEDPADMEFIIEKKDMLEWDYAGRDIFAEMSAAADREARVSFWIDKDGPSDEILRDVRIELLKLKSDEQYGIYGDGAEFGRLWLETAEESDDWKFKYKESFRTFSPVEGIVIVPPWEANTILSIIIDPGMAFGTGLHETTSMCLGGLKEIMKPGDLVLDAGTGSGILAIAAALLGAEEVLAIEKDDDAMASAKGNIAANGVTEKVKLLGGDITLPGLLPEGARFDLILANLSVTLLGKLLPVFKKTLKKGGTLILSGLLDTQADKMCENIRSHGFGEIKVKADGEWVMMEVRE